MTPQSDDFDVVISGPAEDDLDAIHTYVALNGSIGAAEGLVSDLLDRIATLRRFPWRGAIPPEFDGQGLDYIRQTSCPPYRLIYEIDDRRVIIHLVADGRRDMQTLLRQRLLTPPGSPR